MRFAFKIWYLGQNYLGYQRQPNGQTIENYLEIGLIKSKYIDSFNSNSYRGTSRTDQGVNAIGNVFVLDSETEPDLVRLNTYLPDDIIIWSFARVSDTFNPRQKVLKNYHYFLPLSNIPDIKRFDLLEQYIGEHNFRPFIKKHGAGMEYPISRIFEVNHKITNQYLEIEISGDRFGREQIRRMIGLLFYSKYADITPIDILQKETFQDIKSAPPEGLYLQSIKFDPTLIWNYDPTILFKFKRLRGLFKNEVDVTTISPILVEQTIDLIQSTQMRQ